MNQRSIIKEFYKYITLNVCGIIGLSCYILTDTFFISKQLGADGLTSLNLAIPVYSFVHGTGLMLGIGGASKYSIFKGKNDSKSGNAVFSNTVVLCIIFSAIYIILGACLSDKLAVGLGANQEVFDMTNTYLKFILIFSPVFMFNDILCCFIRNDNNPKLSMCAMLFGSMVNIILDYIFIFPLNMGMFGAVFATVLGAGAGICISSMHFIMKNNGFTLSRLKIYKHMSFHILSVGLSSLISEVAAGIIMIIFNVIILKFEGNNGVAAYGIIANVSIVVVSIYTGMAQGMQPLTSRFYGMGDIKAVKRILKYAILTTLATSTVIYTVLLINAYEVVSIFNSENNVQLANIAVRGLEIYFTAIPFVGLNVILAMYFSSTENVKCAHINTVLRGFVVIIPTAFLLSTIGGITGLWLTYTVTEVIVLFITLFVNYKD